VAETALMPSRAAGQLGAFLDAQSDADRLAALRAAEDIRADLRGFTMTLLRDNFSIQLLCENHKLCYFCWMIRNRARMRAGDDEGNRLCKFQLRKWLKSRNN
jgi:hypothetical protein